MKTLVIVLASLLGLWTASCGGAAEEAKNPSRVPDVKTNHARPAGADKTAEAAQRQQKAIEELTQGEVKGGACDAEHQASLEKLMGAVEEAMKVRTGDDGKPAGFTVIDKRTAVFGPDPRNVQIKLTGRGTEVHVMSLGVLPTSLDMIHDGRAATVRSPAAAAMAQTSPIVHAKFGKVTEVQVDSRIVQVMPGEMLEIKVRGQGCGVLIAFMKP